MMTGHGNPKTVMIYDYTRACLKQRAVNFISPEKKKKVSGLSARSEVWQLKRAKSAGGVVAGCFMQFWFGR